MLKANYFKVNIPNGDLHHYDVDIRPDKCPRRVNREIIENVVENFRNQIFQVIYFLNKQSSIFEPFFRTDDLYLTGDAICTPHNLFPSIDSELSSMLLFLEKVAIELSELLSR